MAIVLDASDLLQYLLAATCVPVVIVALFACIYLLFADREALMSEHFQIAPTQVGSGLIGDSIAGLSRPHDLRVSSEERLERTDHAE